MRTRYAVRRDRCHQPGWKLLFKPQALTGAQLLSPSQASWPSVCTPHSFCLKQPSLPSVPDKFSHFGYNTSTSESFLLRQASSCSEGPSPQEGLLTLLNYQCPRGTLFLALSQNLLSYTRKYICMSLFL